MNNTLIKTLKSEYPDYVYSKKPNFKVTEDEISKLFNIINNIVFKGKLKISDAKLMVTDYDNHKDKGQFMMSPLKSEYKVIINIIRYSYGDNFAQIVSVLAHEMIHMYDCMFGELRKRIDSTCGIDSFNVVTYNGKQIVDGYDSHGKYFETLCKKFDSYGLKVKKTYDIRDTNLMKKIDEKKTNSNIDPFLGVRINESKEVDNPVLKKRLETLCSSLKNCNNRLVYVDERNWYIQID